ncbi:MAG: transposase, partial [Candidatus Thiodiazotropha sp. (ex Cardiolucina cf. quadrata)]|nr:transposase [Candidatus Thiodiazotropha sp. (ex Cardiolucina cf. quadrata)]
MSYLNKDVQIPRKPRFYLPGIPAHVIQRGNSRQPVLFESDDYHAYLAWLKEGADKHGCAIHAYCLMTNHVHLL